MKFTKIIYFLELIYCIYCEYLFPNALPDENNYEFIIYENNYELLKNLNKTYNITIPKIVPIKLKHLNYSEVLTSKSDKCFMSNDDFIEKLTIRNISELNNTIYNLINNQTLCIKNFPLYDNISCSYLFNDNISKKNYTAVKYSKNFFNCTFESENYTLNIYFYNLLCDQDELYSKEFTKCIEQKITNQSINEKEIDFQYINKENNQDYNYFLQIPELFYSCSEFLLDLQDVDCFITGSWNYIDNCNKKNLFNIFFEDFQNCFKKSYAEVKKDSEIDCVGLFYTYVKPKFSRFKQISDNLFSYVLKTTIHNNVNIIYTKNRMANCNNKIKKIKTKIYNGEFLITYKALNIFKILNKNIFLFKTHCNIIEKYFNEKIKTGQFRKNNYTCEELIGKMYIYGKLIEYSKNINYYKIFPYFYSN